MKLPAKVLGCTLALASTAIADVCNYGLAAPTGECPNIERQALRRVASAKTICYSANSEVQWSKNNKEPVGAFTTMHAGARIAMKGFTRLDTCERADLVVKIDYDATYPERVTLSVTDAESGDSVFQEDRSVSDLSSDVTRMATHFQNMHSAALADVAAKIAEIQAKAKREAFLQHLPKHWKNSGGLAVDVSITDDILYQTSTQTMGSIKLETTCEVKKSTDEIAPWAGYCTYSFTWANWSRPSCTLQTQQLITDISEHGIEGQSQKFDMTPLQRTPPACPQPVMAKSDFKLIPDKQQTSK